MATIRPFRGIRYNPQKIGELSQVITQPYDRIGPEQQAAYYALHPYNFIRIEMGLHEPDEPDNNVYTRARAYAQTWLAEGVLVRERRPVLYVLEQIFSMPDGRLVARRGLTTALQLTRFDEGFVLPHERTLSAPKTDRLNLTRTTRTSWGHIFVLYPDAENRIDALLQPYLDGHPPAVAREPVIEPAVEQRFWAVDDAALIFAVVEEMAARRPLIIADGHHRYETALSYRDAMRAHDPGAPADAAFNFVLATLVSMSDPGLTILPTHRLIHSYSRMTGAELRQALVPYFDVQPVADRAALEAGLAAAVPEHPRFGFYDGAHVLLTLRSLDVMVELVPSRARVWRALDVAILHEIIIHHIMKMTGESVASQEHIRYLRDPGPGYAAVRAGEANFLFILNPTRVEQVRACAEAGEMMPQKSTDFYPKVIGGLVALPLTGRIGA